MAFGIFYTVSIYNIHEGSVYSNLWNWYKPYRWLANQILWCAWWNSVEQTTVQ